MGDFVFSLDSFKINDTRSAHNDTDYVSLAVKVGNQRALVNVRAMGDVNNGVHQVGMTVQVTVPEGESVAVNYLIVNAGSTTLAKAESALASAAAIIVEGPTGPIGPLPQPGSALPKITDWLNTQLQGIFKAGSCDGPLAAECAIFPYTRLLAKVPFHETCPHLGAKASSSCNKKVSSYVVSWSVTQLTT